MTRIAVPVFILSSLLVACSSVEERRIANGNFNYVDVHKVHNVKVPEGKDVPPFSNDFQIPDSNKSSPKPLIGNAVIVTSPALVMPLVSGSHIEDGSKEAVIWFDQIHDDKALDTAIWDTLISYLDEQGIGVQHFDKEQQVLLTDWMQYDELKDDSWFNWTKVDRSVGRRFEFKLEMKPHGRSAALRAKLTEYWEKQSGELTKDINNVDLRRNEVEVLNKVIGHYEYQMRLADARRIEKIRQGLDIEVGFDSKGEAAFIVKSEYSNTWPRLLLVFRKLGFDVKDLDQSSGLIFVDYQGTDTSWWDNLWSGDSNKLPLKEQNYRIKLGDLGNQTSITFMLDDNTTISPEILNNLFKPFAAVMADDDLDI
ncbi:outer membrane protein assembly factor BamC [Alteromonadaceae bacterium BrNp21-10]|nr:outer membrane protein assembly factor BamC [Alteromonadaceae bacterium BrNp21-10]